MSYRDLKIKVRQLIGGLHAAGIQSGDCICVNAFNDVCIRLWSINERCKANFSISFQLYYSVFYLGIIGSGAIYTGVNPAYTSRELEHHFCLTKPKLVIVEPAMYEKTVSAMSSAGLSSSLLYIFRAEDGLVSKLAIGMTGLNC